MRAATRVGGVCALVLLGGGTACGPSQVTDKRQYLLDTWGESLLRQNYANFRDSAAHLSQAAEVFVDTSSEEQLAELQSRWKATRKPWKRSEIFNFGPNLEHPQRFTSQVNFWPVRTQDIEKALAAGKGTGEVPLGASESGLPALDYLLFEPEASALLLDDRERRQYVFRVALDLALDAREVFDVWDPHAGGYYRELTDAGNGSKLYDSLHAALQEMLRQAVFMLDMVEMKKLLAPLGQEGTPAPELVESPSSAQAIEDVRDDLHCIEVLYFGTDTWKGLDWYLESRGKHLGSLVRGRLDDAQHALGALDGDLAKAVITDPQAVREAARRVADLKRAFEVDILGALSLSVGFTPNDAD